MSTCISMHGEYGEHDLPGTTFGEFVCNRCHAFDEDVAMAEVVRLRAKVARVEEMINEWEAAAVLIEAAEPHSAAWFRFAAKGARLALDDPDDARPERDEVLLSRMREGYRQARHEKDLVEPERDEEGGR